MRGGLLRFALVALLVLFGGLAGLQAQETELDVLKDIRSSLDVIELNALGHRSDLEDVSEIEQQFYRNQLQLLYNGFITLALVALLFHWAFLALTKD